MARPKGSKNNSSTQKQPAKTQQETIENINENVEGVAEAAEQTLVEETQDLANQFKQLQETPLTIELSEEAAENIYNVLESSTSDSEPEGLLSPSEDAKIAQNESESVTEDTPVVEEQLPANMSVKVTPQGRNVVIRGQHLGTVVAQMLAEAYKGAEFGKSFPKLHKKPYTVVLDTPEASYNPEAVVPVYDSTKEYYEATVSSSDPVVFTKELLALGKDGAVVNLKAFGKPLGRRLQIKVFSRTPIDKSAFVHTYARTSIKYTQEELESFYDSPLSRIGKQYGLTETKRDDLIKAVLEEQDK